MVMRRSAVLFTIILCISLTMVPSDWSFSQEGVSTPEQLIVKHLKAFGNPKELAGVKSRGISGKASVEFIQGATGKLVGGQFMCLSEGPKVGIRINFGDINYPGEYLAYNGKEVTVGHITPGQKSPLADFIFLHDNIMKEGLMGGVLSSAWPLLDIKETSPKMKLSETEIDGRPLYELEYGSPGKRPGNMTVKLFFDKKSYLHVRTEYKVRVAGDLSATKNIVAGVPTTPTATAGGGSLAGTAPKDTIMESLPDSIYYMIETFDKFAMVGGVALPQVYNIEYSVEGQGPSFLAKWGMFAEYFTNNGGNIDQTFFVAQK